MKELFFAFLIMFSAVEVTFAYYHDSDCSGDGPACVPLPIPNCRKDPYPPAGVILDPSTIYYCLPGQQPVPGQTEYEVCDAGCGEYIRSYGSVCEAIMTPSPSIVPSSSPCREVFVSSPGPGGQQIQIKKLDCSSPSPQ